MNTKNQNPKTIYKTIFINLQKNARFSFALLQSINQKYPQSLLTLLTITTWLFLNIITLDAQSIRINPNDVSVTDPIFEDFMIEIEIPANDELTEVKLLLDDTSIPDEDAPDHAGFPTGDTRVEIFKDGVLRSCEIIMDVENLDSETKLYTFQFDLPLWIVGTNNVQASADTLGSKESILSAKATIDFQLPYPNWGIGVSEDGLGDTFSLPGVMIAASNCDLLFCKDSDEDGLLDLWENIAVTVLNPLLVFDGGEDLRRYNLFHPTRIFTRVAPVGTIDPEDGTCNTGPKYLLFNHAIAFEKDYGHEVRTGIFGTWDGISDHDGDNQDSNVLWEIIDRFEIQLRKIRTKGHSGRVITTPILPLQNRTYEFSPEQMAFSDGRIVWEKPDLATLRGWLNSYDEVSDSLGEEIQVRIIGKEPTGVMKLYIEEDKHGIWPSRASCSDIGRYNCGEVLIPFNGESGHFLYGNDLESIQSDIENSLGRTRDLYLYRQAIEALAYEIRDYMNRIDPSELNDFPRFPSVNVGEPPESGRPFIDQLNDVVFSGPNSDISGIWPDEAVWNDPDGAFLGCCSYIGGPLREILDGFCLLPDNISDELVTYSLNDDPERIDGYDMDDGEVFEIDVAPNQAYGASLSFREYTRVTVTPDVPISFTLMANAGAENVALGTSSGEPMSIVLGPVLLEQPEIQPHNSFDRLHWRDGIFSLNDPLLSRKFPYILQTGDGETGCYRFEIRLERAMPPVDRFERHLERKFGNNVQENATVIDLEENGIALEDLTLHNSSDIDYYRIQLPRNDELSACLSSLGFTYQPEDLQINVEEKRYDGIGSQNSPHYFQWETEDCSDDCVHLKVYSERGKENHYEIRIDYQPPQCVPAPLVEDQIDPSIIGDLIPNTPIDPDQVKDFIEIEGLQSIEPQIEMPIKNIGDPVKATPLPEPLPFPKDLRAKPMLEIENSPVEIQPQPSPPSITAIEGLKITIEPSQASAQESLEFSGGLYIESLTPVELK